MLTLCKIIEEKDSRILQKLYFHKLERKFKILINNSGFLYKNWIYYDLLKMTYQKNLEMNTSVKIMKLTNQMISKSCNSNMNRKLMIKGFQRDQNC